MSEFTEETLTAMEALASEYKRKVNEHFAALNLTASISSTISINTGEQFSSTTEGVGETIVSVCKPNNQGQIVCT